MEAHTEPWEAEKLSALLEAGRTAILRSRYVLGLINIATVLILSAEFNTYLTYIRHIIPRFYDKSGQLHSTALQDAAKELNELRWRDLDSVSIPFIGVKFSTADVAITGGIGMFILVIWLYSAVRGRHHVINRILDEASLAINNNIRNKASYLYHGIAHYFIFTPRDRKDSKAKLFATWGFRALLYSPAWVLLSVLLMDAANLTIRQLREEDKSKSLLSIIPTPEQAEILARFIVGAVIFAFCLNQCMACDRLDQATFKRLRLIQLRLDHPDDIPA